jgi:hypothetical protein
VLEAPNAFGGVFHKYWTMRSNRIRNAFGDDNLILWGADNAIYHRIAGTPAPKKINNLALKDEVCCSPVVVRLRV